MNHLRKHGHHQLADLRRQVEVKPTTTEAVLSAVGFLVLVAAFFWQLGGVA